MGAGAGGAGAGVEVTLGAVGEEEEEQGTAVGGEVAVAFEVGEEAVAVTGEATEVGEEAVGVAIGVVEEVAARALCQLLAVVNRRVLPFSPTQIV